MKTKRPIVVNVAQYRAAVTASVRRELDLLPE